MLAALLLPAAALFAKVVPAPLFQDHAVLQHGKPVPVWGTADAGEKVAVSFAGQTLTTTADAAGDWRVTLAPLAISAKPATLTLRGTNTLVLNDVLVGEVWLCAGQSNMELTLAKADNAEAELAAARFPLIRQLRIGYKVSNIPLRTAGGKWIAASPETAGKFTAVGYFFARELNQKLGGVPVGLINASWGGTSIEPWMSPAALAHPDFAFVEKSWQAELADYPALQAKYEAAEAVSAAKAAEAKATGKTYRKPWRRAPAKPDGSPHEHKPTAIHYGMIHPLLPSALAGVLWYQGEGNSALPAEYKKLFPAFITDLRASFAQPDLPFYWVQLPAFIGGPGEDWPALREAQTAALALPHTGQAIAIDVGAEKNIHPTNKQDVGHRLALIALRKHHGQNVIASGPLFAGATFTGATARVSFTEIADGLVAKDGAIKGFELAGADKKFVPADARIEGASVIVTADAVPAPVAVRYGWKNYSVVTLANSAGLPAAPFRSDSW
ncbi:MAG: sialate O-acetylesterase [Burkholderiales bacterium]|nr:sialate O-acetylesterase [Opitutaceae bacterium]